MPQLHDLEAIDKALATGEPRVGMLLVRRDSNDAQLGPLIARAQELGIPIHKGSDSELSRLCSAKLEAQVLALVERDPSLDAEQVFALAGAKWLITGAEYPGNVGAALRTAEVAGADAAFIDANLDHEGRRRALRTSMGTQRFMPVFWEQAADVIERARRADHAVVALEDVGTREPWELNLTRPSLFIVGGEEHGLSASLIQNCDAVLRIPMRGFIPSYNLQAAVAVVSVERLRQLGD